MGKIITRYKKSNNIFIKLSKNNIFRTSVLVIFFLLLTFLNFIHIGQGKYSLDQIFKVLPHVTQNPRTFVGLSPAQAQEIQEGIWGATATAVAAVGLALAGLVTQSLTRNPLADASTLGMIQAGIFGIIVCMSFGFVSYYLKFIFAVIGGLVGSLLLMVIISFAKGKASVSKVVLTGLAIGIIFKTFSFLVRTKAGEAKLLSSVSYHYVLGGAESVNKVIGDNQWLVLYISSGLIAVGTIATVLIAKNMTLLELGEDRAKNLGVKVRTTKIVSVLIIILVVPSSIMLVGNLAFVGLFSVHIARYLTKSRSYLVILTPAIVFAALSSSLGYYLTEWIPSINSGLWMTFIGAPYLIYAGIRGLK